MSRPSLPRLLPIVVFASAIAGCAPHVVRPPEPPPMGPFRTTAGEATHPRCTAPGRQGPGGVGPRCVVSFGRGTTAMTASPDGTQVLIALLDVEPTTWTLPAVAFGHHFDPIPAEENEEHVGEREGPQALSVGPGGKVALFAVEDRVIRYDLASGKVLGDFEGPEEKGMVNDVVWSHDGRRLLIANASDGKARVLDAANGRLLRTLPVDGRVVQMAFGPDDRQAALGTEVGTVAIVALDAKAAKARVLTPSTQEITGLGFVGSDLVVAARDGKIRRFVTATGVLVQQVDTGAPITRCAITERDGLVGVSDDQNAIRIYTVPGFERRAHYPWHRASITALAWGLGPTLLAADNDGELAAWDVPATP
ncbi:MAG: WD40 repeat domain-containing protein [Candidatus Binatia bacterium]